MADTFHSYTWDSDANPATIDTIGLTYDAFDRVVEQNQSGTYYQIVYTPMNTKFGKFKAGVMQQIYVPLPGGANAEYYSWGLSNYRHADWLGTVRLESSASNHSILDNNAYAPFGEPYAQTGNGEISFTGQNKDTVWLQYDFLYRQYDPKQGRWISPDPSGLAAVDPSDPQTWNRYAYVENRPTNSIDALGMNLIACDPFFGCGGYGGGGGGGCDPILGCCDPELGCGGCSPDDASCGPCDIDPLCGGGGGGGGGGPVGSPPPEPPSPPQRVGGVWANNETLGLPGGLNAQPFGSLDNLFGLLPNLGCGDFPSCGTPGPSVGSFQAQALPLAVPCLSNPVCAAVLAGTTVAVLFGPQIIHAVRDTIDWTSQFSKCLNQFIEDVKACNDAYPPGPSRNECHKKARQRFDLCKASGPVQ